MKKIIDDEIVIGEDAFSHCEANPVANIVGEGSEQDLDISYNHIGILHANLLYDIMNGKGA